MTHTCRHEVTVGASCVDANSQQGTCRDDGSCRADIVDCPPPDQCHEAGVWNPALGACEYALKPDGSPCDDGDLCTRTDSCQAGVCVGADPVECVALDQCHDAGVCDPTTGLCSNPTKPDGTPCSDNNACTNTDTCQEGVCTPGTDVVCAPAAVCKQAGICNPETGQCVYPDEPDGTPCDDGNPCTLDDTCQAGTCMPGTSRSCPPADQCLEDGVCNPTTGECDYQPKPDGTVCDDGNACTQADTCQAGICVGGNPVICSALDDCHEVGTCDPVTGLCTNPAKPDGSTCSDGNPCTLNDTCQQGVCTPGTTMACDPAGPCQADGICDPLIGDCVYADLPDGTVCGSAGPCMQDAVCQAGTCVPGAPIACPPPDACHEAGVCDQETGECVYAAKADGTLCGTESACAHDICVSGTCMLDQPKPDGTLCDDGNLCTQNDTCQGGVCVGGAPVVCTALDDCHEPGVCDPATGVCSNPAKPDGEPCDDGDRCTEVDICQGGVCTPGGAVTCPAPDQCHEQGSCNPATGQCDYAPLADGTPCDAGDPCSENDTCQAGLCVPGTPVACPPLGDCYEEGVCDALLGGCVYDPKPTGTPCGQESACLHDICDQGVCLLDQPKPDGEPCDDGDLCTLDDACQSGVCTPGTTVVCDAADPCSSGICDPATGQCVYTIAEGASCIDPNPCNENGVCQADGSCLGTPVVCDNGDVCSEGACDPGTGECVYSARQCPSSGPCFVAVCIPDFGCDETPKDCNDGNECTDDFCAAETGTCQHVAVDDSELRPCDAGAGICQGGTCRHRPGETCNTVDDCVQDGMTVCESNTCCRPEWTECTFDTDCCTGRCQDALCRQL